MPNKKSKPGPVSRFLNNTRVSHSKIRNLAWANVPVSSQRFHIANEKSSLAPTPVSYYYYRFLISNKKSSQGQYPRFLRTFLFEGRKRYQYHHPIPVTTTTTTVVSCLSALPQNSSTSPRNYFVRCYICSTCSRPEGEHRVNALVLTCTIPGTNIYYSYTRNRLALYWSNIPCTIENTYEQYRSSHLRMTSISLRADRRSSCPASWGKETPGREKGQKQRTNQQSRRSA